ncbi:MAG: flagellar hook-basal body complex protein FliE [Verrucomicrobiota bacterium]|jgi:flagellar hook-basal body complex protein FliE
MITPLTPAGSFPLNSVELPGLSASQAGALSPADLMAPRQVPRVTGSSFGAMLERFVSGVDATMHKAEVEQAKVVRGESTNLHQAMIAGQESSLAFSLMVEVRNKLIEGYQELMRMQV